MSVKPHRNTGQDFRTYRTSDSDILGIVAFQNRLWIDTYSGAGDRAIDVFVRDKCQHRETEVSIRKRRGLLQNPAFLFRVAKLTDGEIIGFIEAERTGAEVHLSAIYVEPRFHGRGVAQLLWSDLLDWGGVEIVTLEVAASNPRAIGFYRKLGFTQGIPGQFGPIKTISMKARIPKHIEIQNPTGIAA